MITMRNFEGITYLLMIRSQHYLPIPSVKSGYSLVSTMSTNLWRVNIRNTQTESNLQKIEPEWTSTPQPP